MRLFFGLSEDNKEYVYEEIFQLVSTTVVGPSENAFNLPSAYKAMVHTQRLRRREETEKWKPVRNPNPRICINKTSLQTIYL